MSSSRSVAAARARRSGPEPQQFKQAGPITSINSSASFNPGSSRLAPQQQQQQQYQQQQQQQQQQQEPTGKLTVANAIALMSLRIGRLETFAFQYNLDKSNNELNGHSSNENEHSQSEQYRQPEVDDSVVRNIMARLDIIEKDKKQQSLALAQAQAQALQKQVSSVAPSVAPSVASSVSSVATPLSSVASSGATSVASDNATIQKMDKEIKSLCDELKETKDLLMKLQAFTMDTNQKLVNIMFHDTNGFDIEQFEDIQSDCQDQEKEQFLMQYENNAIEILDEVDPETVPFMQTISGNLKDIINEELAHSSI